MLARASVVLVGVIEEQKLERWPWFRVSLPRDVGGDYWRILRRRVRVETVLRGSETRKSIDVYEVHWTGGTSGDWNSTRDGERYLFLLREERGRYHVVQDWWRSIFPVTTGPHTRAPLDDSRPMWERIALMNFWIQQTDPAMRIPYPYFMRSDPGDALGGSMGWRVVKLERGLVRHPAAGVRIPACQALLALGGWSQDECWEMLSQEDKASVGGSVNGRAEVRKENRAEGAAGLWKHFDDRDTRRLMTAMNDEQLRPEFCRLYEKEYPGDKDNGCPADRPPPATIVTEAGDVPLVAAWPR